MNVGNWLYKRSLVSEDQPAILFGHQVVTYGRMNKRVNRLSHAMLKTGLANGDRVGVLSRNCPEFLEIYFACAKTGIIFVPLNFRLAPPELAYQITDSGLRLLFLNLELEPQAKKSEAFMGGQRPSYVGWGSSATSQILHYEDFIKGEPEKEPPVNDGTVTLDSPQMIMYTSGTTGTPKGALLSQQKTLFNTLNAQIYFDLYSRDIMLLVLPLFHSGGLNIMAVPTLYVGGSIVLSSQFDPQEFLSLIESHRVTQTMVVPTMINTILNETRPEDFNLSSLRSVLVAGEPISEHLMHEAQDRGFPVRQLFGQTETSIQLWVPQNRAREKASAVGLPVFHGDVRVVDENDQTLRPRQIGEIVVKGPIQMMSYWNLPQESRQTIKDGWLHTNDLAFVDEDGYVHVVGRRGDMYISGGENVYPAEIEKVLATHPKIFEVAIIGVPHEKWGKTGHAFIKLKNGERIDYEEITSYLQDKVASYKIPKSVQFIDEFPKTASGKIKKSELVKLISP
jgi:fatty-acyl-CoA synthase